MVFFNYASMEMSAKIVYYGPGLCGKTTNLKWIFNQMPQVRRGEMVSLATETDRTLFFDLLPLSLGKVGDFTTRIQLYTVPGQVFYNSTRKLVLKGVDGIVFVADSQEPMLDANIESIENLQENLNEQKLSLRKIPWIIQYNKRDLPGILPIGVLNRHLNFMDVPWYESVAMTGAGVMESLAGIAKLTLRHLRKKAGEDLAEDSPEMKLFEEELFRALGGDPSKAAKTPVVAPEPTKIPPTITQKPAVPEKTTPPSVGSIPASSFQSTPPPVHASAPVKISDNDSIPFENDEDFEPKPVKPASKLPPAVESKVNANTFTTPITVPVGSVTGIEGEGHVIDRDFVQKIRIPIKISKDEDVSHVNLNLKLEIECVLVSELEKRQESRAEKMATKALEDFLLGKTKKKP